MERLTDDYFEKGERGKKEEERVSHKAGGDGDTSVREKVKVLFHSCTETDCRQGDLRR